MAWRTDGAHRGDGPNGEDVELSHNQFRRDKANREVRPYMTLKGQRRRALGYVCVRKCTAPPPQRTFTR